jgi:hypothetical protein
MQAPKRRAFSRLLRLSVDLAIPARRRTQSTRRSTPPGRPLSQPHSSIEPSHRISPPADIVPQVQSPTKPEIAFGASRYRDPVLSDARIANGFEVSSTAV